MTTVDCPVCGKTDLADHLAQCPQCNADLECFRLLEALYEAPSSPVADEEVVESLSRRVDDIGLVLHRVQDSMQQLQRVAERRTAMLILVMVMLEVVVVAAGAWQWVAGWNTPPDPVEVMSSATPVAKLATERPLEKALREALAKTVASIEQVSQQVAALEQRVAALAIRPAVTETQDPSVAEAEPKPSFFIHEPQKNESLWLIAQRYYQQGMLYPAILETNPGLGIYFDPDDGPLLLPPNRQAAEAIVARVVFTNGVQRFLRYQVQVADTWQSIAERFYGRGNDTAQLQTLNADTQPQPGTRVLVPLSE